MQTIPGRAGKGKPWRGSRWMATKGFVSAFAADGGACALAVSALPQRIFTDSNDATVCAISVEIVIGPTPPGTGV